MRQWKHIALILTLGMGASGLIFAQESGWQRDRDGGYGRDSGYARSNDRGYRDGLSQGQADRAARHRYNYQTRDFRRGDASYRDAYRAGYERGYNNGNYGYREPYSQGYPTGNYPYGNGYPNGRGGRHGNNLAYSQGLRDGQLDGEKDLRTGHSYRPSQGDNYKHADRGYDSSFGDRNTYKQEYRSAYINGYEQGYRRGR